MNAVENAKKVLRENGYFVDNLWHIEDVQSLHKGASAEDAHRILNVALTNAATMEQIWYAIKDALEDEEGYIPLSDEDED
jgi:predicted Rossmann-fold nucleotide-binding protein